MRVVYFTSIYPRPDNPTRGVFCYHYCRGIGQLGHEVRVVSPRAWNERPSGVKADPLPGFEAIPAEYPTFYYVPGMLRSTYGASMWWSAKGALRAAIREMRADAVLSYWAHPDGAVAVRAAHEAGVPAGIIVGGSDVLVLAKKAGLRKTVVTRALKGADAVFTVSKQLREACINLGVDGGRVHAVYQGVDHEVFHPGDAGEARRRVGVEEDGAKILLYVGNLVPIKGLEVMVGAMGTLRDRGVNFRLYVVGSGPSKAGLEAQIASLSLGERVKFVGPMKQSGLGDWYRAADLTVMSSHSEGIPNALRETMACNTPFVATRVGGIHELAEGTGNLLVPAGNPGALAEAIEKRLAEGRVNVAQAWALGTWADCVGTMLDVLVPRQEAAGASAARRAAVAV